MLSQRDPNGQLNGRSSRASNMSNMSRRGSKHPNTGTGQQDLLSSAGPGVMSMLRTSTEMGNVGNTSDLVNVPRAPQRRGASSRLSTASSISTHSTRTNRHHRQRPSSSSAARYSMTREPMPNVPQYAADTLSPTMMNFPSSSPLVPTSSRERDSHRSQSMTHTSLPPPVRLSANRSLGNLQGNEHIQRPRSPYHYPTRLRRPSHRPASPAWSNIPGMHPSRLYSQGNQNMSHHASQMRLRMPSDASLGYQEHGQRLSRRPSRGPSPGYYHGPQSDIPPVPPLHKHYRPAMEQARLLARSVQGSGSSGSTNLRTDSDTPSSDMPQPSTPQDGVPMNSYAASFSTRVVRRTAPRVVREDIPSSPPYYDYSEQFEHQEYTEAGAEPVPTGYMHRPKAMPRGRLAMNHEPKMNTISRNNSLDYARADVPSIAELPASPVAKRITRDLILEGLGPASITSDLVPSDKSREAHSSCSAEGRQEGSGEANHLQDGSPTLPISPNGNRHSILSQAGSSVIDSSTLNFAVRYSIPAMEAGATLQSRRTSESPASPEKSTEDGMSELLAGYQHTDSKRGCDVSTRAEMNSEKTRVVDKCSPKRNSHAYKSSDEQSFKSCTDVPEAESPSPEPDKEEEAVSFQSATDTLATPKKRSDPGSSILGHNVINPARGTSMPQPSLQSRSSKHTSSHLQRPVSDFPLSNGTHAVLRKPFASSQDLSCATAALNARSKSKSSVKQDSMSVSGSSSTLSMSQQPPHVPPRDSSASKEAQRFHAVSSFLMRRVVPARFSKGKKTVIQDQAEVSPERKTTEPYEPYEPSLDTNDEEQAMPPAPETPKGRTKILEKASPVDKGVSYKEMSPTTSGHGDSTKPVLSNTSTAAVLHCQSSDSPPVEHPEPSSVYSPYDTSPKTRGSLSLGNGIPCSPTRGHDAPENSRRDSQTTTHLEWPGRRSYGSQFASGSEPRLPLPSVQEDSTTDLRLSQYKYGAQHYLPDLKEESHEDSSLNTSASNLKNSHIRFPYGGGPGARASLDDQAIFSRRSSMRSHQKSSAVEPQCLPSIDISQGNLLDKFHDVLGIRFSRSDGDMRLEVPSTGSELPQRSASVGEVRVVNELGAEGLKELGKAKGKEPAQFLAVNDSTLRRAYSPDIVAELEQLTIPSVEGLTTRISEMMPSASLREALKGYNKEGELQDVSEFPDEEVIMEHALEELQEILPPSQKRSSARLRPVPGYSSVVLVDDNLWKSMEGKRSPGGGPSAEVEGRSTMCKGETATGSRSNDYKTMPVGHTELQVPSPAVLRPRSNTVSGNQVFRASVESALSSRRSLRSIASTPTATDTRPWNFDKNYPWATTTRPSVDISLPPSTAVRQSPRPGPSHLCNKLSEASTGTFASTHTPTTSPFGTTTDFDVNRQSHRFSVFGRSGDQAHAVGERYPTSALSPPTAIFRDNLSACDTSDDEDFTISRTKRKTGLRKRFSSAARNTALSTPRVTRSKVNPAELASPASIHEDSTSTLHNRGNEAPAFNSHRHTFRDAEGMTVVAYRRQQVMASIRRWWHKGAELVRSIKRRRNER